MKIKKIFLLLILISGVRSAKPLFQEVAAIGLASASIVFGCTFNTEPFSAMSNEQKLVLIFFYVNAGMLLIQAFQLNNAEKEKQRFLEKDVVTTNNKELLVRVNALEQYIKTMRP